MRYLVLFLALVMAVGCSKENATEPLCIQVPEKTINLADQLMIVNCNNFVLGINIEGEKEHYSLENSDTLYLKFDTIGIYTMFYYNASLLPASPPLSELIIQVE